MGLRPERVQAAMKREISKIIHSEIKDPRIGFITITRVDITQDLRYAKVFFSILGEAKAKEASLEGLKSATGYIRRLIGQRLKLRFVPNIVFKSDDSIEYSIELEEKLKKLYKEQGDGARRD